MNEKKKVSNGERLEAANQAVCRTRLLYSQLQNMLSEVTSEIFTLATAGHERNNGKAKIK